LAILSPVRVPVVTPQVTETQPLAVSAENVNLTAADEAVAKQLEAEWQQLLMSELGNSTEDDAVKRDDEIDEAESKPELMGSASFGTIRLLQCRRCLCVVSATQPDSCGSSAINTSHVSQNQSGFLSSRKAAATASTVALADQQQSCLQDIPCCDCDACHNGWSASQYSQDPAVGLQCQSACLRCRSRLPYTVADVRTLHPIAAKDGEFKRWEEFANNSVTLAWAARRCAESGDSVSEDQPLPGLRHLVFARASCLMTAFGHDLARQCACQHGDEEACSKRASEPHLSGKAGGGTLLESVAALEGLSRTAISHGDLKDSGACVSAKSFHASLRPATSSLAFHLTSTAFEQSSLVVAAVVSWAEAEEGRLNRVDAAVANDEIYKLDQLETSAMVSRLLLQESKLWGSMLSCLSEETAVNLRNMAEEIPAASACSSALTRCGSNGTDCGDYAAAVVQLRSTSQATAQQLLAEDMSRFCSNLTMLAAVMDVAADCSGPLPAKQMRGARDVVQGFEEDDSLCHRTRLFVASALAAPIDAAEDEPVVEEPEACTSARSRCSESSSCAKALQSMTAQRSSIKGMLAEAEKLCSSKDAVLLAMDVTAECPGLLPQKEMRESRDALAQEEPKVLCKKMGELVDVLELLLQPEPTAQCLRASAECKLDEDCNSLAKAVTHGSKAVTVSVDAALALCGSQSSLLAALHVAADCSQLSAGQANRAALARKAYSQLRKTPESELCMRVREFKDDVAEEQNAGDTGVSNLTAAVLPTFSTVKSLTASALPNLTVVFRKRIVEAFDVMPRDGQLNVVELQSFASAIRNHKDDAAETSANETEAARKQVLFVPGVLKLLASSEFVRFQNMTLLDTDGNLLVESKELETFLEPVLRDALDQFVE